MQVPVQDILFWANEGSYALSMITRVHAQSAGIPRFGQRQIIPGRLNQQSAISPLHFGQDVSELSSQPKRNLLLPATTPMFFLHGLSSNSTDLDNVTGYVEGAEPNRPIYASYIPEAHDGKPIENPKDPTDIPSAKFALHDIGSFRYQYIRNNLEELATFLEKIEPLSEEERDVKLAEYFEILPEAADDLIPIIKDFVLYPSFHLPGELKQQGYARCLLHLTEEEIRGLKQEVSKLKNPAAFADRNIIDTGTLYNAAIEAGFDDEDINRDPYTNYTNAKKINLRPIHFREIAELEGYLMLMEERMTQALIPVLGDDLEKAQKTAVKLMEKISPKGMALGYSQGGVILQSALMDYLDNGAKHSGEKEKIHQNPTLLAARYIGLSTSFSSPMRGTPRQPQFAITIMDKIHTMMGDRRVMRKLADYTEGFLDWFIWRQKIKMQPSLAEMLEEGSVSKRTHAFVNRNTSLGPSTIDDFDGTILTVADKGDAYVNPESSKLVDDSGNSAINVFNIDVEPFELPDDTPYLIHDPDTMIINNLMFLGKTAVKLLLKMPDGYKQAFYDHVAPIYNQAARHSGLLMNTDMVFTDIGKKILTDTRNQLSLLNTKNFEPLRYQSLIARRKVYHRDILSQDTQQAAIRLKHFTDTYPTFIDALIDNAREALPFKTSASLLASQILNDTLDMLDRVLDAEPVSAGPMGEVSLKEVYRASMKKCLETISAADLGSYGASDGVCKQGVSKRAQELLDIHFKAA